MIHLPKYTKKDILIFATVFPLFVGLLNYVLFGSRYFSDAKVFAAATCVTAIIMGISWQLHTWVAVVLRNRFPKNREMVKRMAIAIFLFILMTGITLTLLFWGYDQLGFLGYQLDETTYNWALLMGVISNIFVTVVHESVSSFEKWKTTLTETEQLKKEYMHSRLMGLKSQVSPHFLFNSLNSLSSLIHEDPAKAEKFLDEMSKVYRYLLRTHEEQTIELGTELQFVRSYFHLLKARYGKGVELVIDVSEEDRQKLIPPFTMQILLDNIMKLNLISKEHPLLIYIRVNDSGLLEIKNNVQKKISSEVLQDESQLDSISNKFRLLCQQSIDIHEAGLERVMKVPLINPEKKIQHEPA